MIQIPVTGKVTLKGTIKRLREMKERNRKEEKRLEARITALEDKRGEKKDDDDDDDDEDDDDE